MEPQQHAPSRPGALLPGATALALVAAATALLLSAATQVREARLLRLVSSTGKGALSPARVDHAEHVVTTAAGSALGLNLLAAVLLFVLLARLTRRAQREGITGLRHGPTMAGFGGLIPFYGLVVLDRAFRDLWVSSAPDLPSGSDIEGRTAPRLITRGWILFVVLNIPRAAVRTSLTSPGARVSYAVGVAGTALLMLLGAYWVLAVTLRWRAKTAAPEVSLPAPVLVQVRGLLVASLVIALVGLSVGSVRAARVPDGLRLTASERALPTATDPPVSPTAPPAAPDAAAPVARYVLRSSVGFTVQLPVKPVVTHQDQKTPQGTVLVTTYDAMSDTADDVVQSFVFPQELDPAKLLPLLIDQEKKAFSATASKRTSGVLGGHRFEQALLTDSSGTVIATRDVAFRHGAIVLLGSPIPELSTMIASLKVTVR